MKRVFSKKSRSDFMDQLNSLKANTVGVSSPAVAFGQIYSSDTVHR